MSGRSEDLFADYARAHSTRGNRVCHLIGIPLILFSAVLALSAVPVSGFWRASEPAAAAFVLLCLTLDPLAGLAVALFLSFSDYVARKIFAGSGSGSGTALVMAAVLFSAGWVFQLVGHSVFERNRPAFLRNLTHLFVGPLWIARKILSIT